MGKLVYGNDRISPHSKWHLPQLVNLGEFPISLLSLSLLWMGEFLVVIIDWSSLLICVLYTIRKTQTKSFKLYRWDHLYLFFTISATIDRCARFNSHLSLLTIIRESYDLDNCIICTVFFCNFYYDVTKSVIASRVLSIIYRYFMILVKFILRII